MAILVLASCASKPPPAALAPATLKTIAAAAGHERQRRYDRARALYRQAVRAAPDRASGAYAARKFAMALLFWGEYGPARRELQRAVRLVPEDVASWHDLGMVDHRLGDLPAAEADFRQAKTLAPADPRPRIALAALLWKQSRLPAALGEYRELLRLELSPALREKVEWAIAALERATAP